MKKLLIATDLDATLLDHQTYQYEAALPAIALLQEKGYPIVFNSSKTIAEQTQLRQEIGIRAPFIVENGAAVVIPSGQLDCPESSSDRVQYFGSSYEDITRKLAQLRQQGAYQFRGFADLSAAEVVEYTGLALEQAVAAKQRSGSEPLLWEDDEASYLDFAAAVVSLGLQNTRGGRFRHVTAKTDKGKALNWVVEGYKQTFPEVDWTVVALGDSPNDVPMLKVADIAVWVANPHRTHFFPDGIEGWRRPTHIGPAGWAESIFAIVRELDARSL